MAAMTASEWLEWQAFDLIEPFGEWRAEYRAARQMALTYNMNRGRGQTAMDPKNLIPRFDERFRDDIANDVDAQLAAALGGFPEG